MILDSEMSFMKEESFTPCPLAAAFGKWTFLCCAVGPQVLTALTITAAAYGGSTVVVGVLSIHVRLDTVDRDGRLSGMEKQIVMPCLRI